MRELGHFASCILLFKLHFRSEYQHIATMFHTSLLKKSMIRSWKVSRDRIKVRGFHFIHPVSLSTHIVS